MTTKTCRSCNIEKSVLLFESKGTKQPIGNRCKECRNNEDRLKKEMNRDNWNEKCRKFYNENKDSINSTRRKNLQKRRDTEPHYRVMMALHCRLYMAVKEKVGNTMKLTGCSKEELFSFLEAEFEPGMTWENYGKWHIDHIRPCASFNLEDPEEQRKCFHWTNLQPLWAIDNLKKGAKFT